MADCIRCPNCNGKGKVSAGIWIDEMEDNLMHRYETCPICSGEGIVSMTGKKCSGADKDEDGDEE